ncbi:MAG: hypothetical protein SGCHY_005097, partial [Lobulomycetales sp.]
MDSTRTCFICTGFNLDLATLSKEWESNESKMAFLNRLRKSISHSFVCENCRRFDHVVGLVGESGNGKSLLLNFLAKRPVKSTYNAQMNIELRVSDPLSQVAGGISSVTLFPFFCAYKDVLFCDFPGFMDTRGPFFELLSHLFIKVLLKVRKFKFVCVQAQISAHIEAGDRNRAANFLKLISCGFIQPSNTLIVWSKVSPDSLRIKKKNRFAAKDMLPSFMTDDSEIKHISATWLPAPSKANMDYGKQHVSIRKEIMAKIASLEPSHVIFDVPYTPAVNEFLALISSEMILQARNQITVLLEEYIHAFKPKPYEIGYLEALLDEKKLSVLEVVDQLKHADILPQSPETLYEGILATSECLETLDFFSPNQKQTRMTIRAWTTGSTVFEFLKRLSSYTHPSYDFSLGSTLPQKLVQWSLLCREHYLDLSGFEGQIHNLLSSELSDTRVFSEIFRMKKYRLDCCRRLCEVWEQLGSDLKTQVDQLCIANRNTQGGDTSNSKEKQQQQLTLSSDEAGISEFFKSTHMDSGIRILRLGLAELASQISRGAIPGLILTSTGMVTLAENSTLSAVLPVMATTAAVPLALIAVGAGITLGSVVFALYRHLESYAAQSISALNLDFSPFLWEIEVWKQVEQVIRGDDNLEQYHDDTDPALKSKRDAIGALFARLDVRFSKYCTRNLADAKAVRGQARGSAEWIAVIDSTIGMYETLDDAMRAIRQSCLGTT